MFSVVYKLKKIYQRHFLGEQGINKILKLAYPVMVSQGSESSMTFIGRFMVSHLGKDFPALSMSGGMTSFVFMIGFTGTVGYTTAIVAQYLGANRASMSGKVLSSAFLLCLILAPIIYLAGFFIGPSYLRFSGHPEDIIQIEMKLALIILLYGIVFLMKFSLAGFFAGLGKTSVIMKANLMALIFYIPICYAFVNYETPFLNEILGLYGVPYASVVANILILIIYAFYLVKREIRELYLGNNWQKPNFTLIKKLLKYGGPSGVEYLIAFFTFITFVNLFHRFGDDAKASITIALSWDLLVFLPVLGLNVATTSLVGKAMGAGRPDEAVKVTFTSLKLALIFMGLVAICFQVFADELVMLFIPKDTQGIDYTDVKIMGHAMMRTVGIYCLFDAVMLVFSGALRGAGDTRWCMMASMGLHLTMLAITYFFIVIYPLPPIKVWYIFVCLLFFLSMTFMGRFFQGGWKRLKIIEE